MNGISLFSWEMLLIIWIVSEVLIAVCFLVFNREQFISSFMYLFPYIPAVAVCLYPYRDFAEILIVSIEGFAFCVLRDRYPEFSARWAGWIYDAYLKKIRMH